MQGVPRPKDCFVDADMDLPFYIFFDLMRINNRNVNKKFIKLVPFVCLEAYGRRSFPKKMGSKK